VDDGYQEGWVDSRDFLLFLDSGLCDVSQPTNDLNYPLECQRSCSRSRRGQKSCFEIREGEVA
jgi:hypothetical protein